MSRSGYSEDYDDDRRIYLYRGWVANATRGKRGQTMFRDLLAALDAMPEKRLIAQEIMKPTSEVCALGALGQARGVLNLQDINPEDACYVAVTFNIAECLAREIVYVNDEAACSISAGKKTCPECNGHGNISSYCYRCQGTGEVDAWRHENPEERWVRVRSWVASQIKDPCP